MIRLALPKGRNLAAVSDAFRAAGIPLDGLEDGSRRLWRDFPEHGFGALLVKDRDLPLYVLRGVADCGVVGRDVLDEVDGDLLVPLEIAAGGSRLSLIAPSGRALPAAGENVRLATKYPRLAGRWLERQSWSAELLELSGGIELAPLVGLADFILDIVQSGATLRAHGLVELAVVQEIRPCFVVHRSAWQRRRAEIGRLVGALEAAGVAA
ncbi:MAG: ATP phosphoribosyltransferase [Thermoanaerobaculia bacterium]